MANPFRFTAIPIRDQICFLRFLRYKDDNNILEVLLCVFGLKPIFFAGENDLFLLVLGLELLQMLLVFLFCLNPKRPKVAFSNEYRMSSKQK